MNGSGGKGSAESKRRGGPRSWGGFLGYTPVSLGVYGGLRGTAELRGSAFWKDRYGRAEGPPLSTDRFYVC